MKHLLGILLISVAISVKAQESGSGILRISGSLGIGMYLQSDLRDLNENLKNQLPFNVKLVSNFPPRPFYGLGVMIKVGKNIAIGPDYQFHSTGSRLGLRDYSGAYTFDQIISAHSVGLCSEFLVSRYTHSALGLMPKAGAEFATWKISEKYQIGETETNTVYRCKGTNYFIEPAIEYKWMVIPHLSISIIPGFHVDLGSHYYLNGNKKAEAKQKPRWIGPRLSMQINYLP